MVAAKGRERSERRVIARAGAGDGVGPRGVAVGGFDAGTDVLLSAELVDGRIVEAAAEDLAVGAYEHSGLLRIRGGGDLEAQLGSGGGDFVEDDASGGVEAAGGDRGEDCVAGQLPGADHHPAAAGVGGVAGETLEVVGVVDGDAVDAAAGGEEDIPHLLEG